MGSKKVKAIVIDKFKMPPLHDRAKVIGVVKDYGKKLRDEPAIQNLTTYGTAMVADLMNHAGGLPVRNFSSGMLARLGFKVRRLKRVAIGPVKLKGLGVVTSRLLKDRTADAADESLPESDSARA